MALKPTIDPVDAGFDPDRLARVDALTHAYVDDGRFPFVQLLIARGGEIVHHDLYGFADRDSERSIRDDSIVRVYSMTKPVTSVALMMLYEQGKVLLEDPVSTYLPSFAEPRVWVGGDHVNYTTREAEREVTVHDVLTHMSGLTYGFQHQHPLDALYRTHELGDFTPSRRTLAEEMEILGSLPLQFDPGTGWCYSMSTDVCGAIVEVLSGRPLDEFFATEIFEPLGMVDTSFWVEGEDRLDRFTTNHLFYGGTTNVMDPWDRSIYHRRPPMLSGGGGLVSTMNDYHRFTCMLANGGELDGARLLSNRTTAFRIDPAEELHFVFLTQLLPSSTYPIRRQLQATIYQALVD